MEYIFEYPLLDILHLYGESLLGDPFIFSPPFSLLPQSVDGGERGGWWDGFDLHARVRDGLR